MSCSNCTVSPLTCLSFDFDARSSFGNIWWDGYWSSCIVSSFTNLHLRNREDMSLPILTVTEYTFSKQLDMRRVDSNTITAKSGYHSGDFEKYNIHFFFGVVRKVWKHFTNKILKHLSESILFPWVSVSPDTKEKEIVVFLVGAIVPFRNISITEAMHYIMSQCLYGWRAIASWLMWL